MSSNSATIAVGVLIALGAILLCPYFGIHLFTADPASLPHNAKQLSKPSAAQQIPKQRRRTTPAEPAREKTRTDRFQDIEDLLN